MSPSPAKPEARRWRLVVHAMDRTGPPMLALAFGRWLGREHPDVTVEVLAFRGGPLVDVAAESWTVRVVLDDEEPWSGASAHVPRAAVLRDRLADLPFADVTLLVSVAAGQVLELLPAATGRVVTWAVEVGEDLHWLDDDIGLAEHTDRWLAGSRATADELAARGVGPVALVPEFIDPGPAPDPADRAELRQRLGAVDDELLVVGAGIGTHRKGIDLFAESALVWRRSGGPPARFTWIGGTRDPLHPRVQADRRLAELSLLSLAPEVPDLERWLAAADVFLHPARADAFPLVCLHASLAGTPVVAFDGVGGVREMFGPAFVGAPYPDLTALVGQVLAMQEPAHRAEVAAAQEAQAKAFAADAAGPRLYDALAAP